MSQQEDEKDGQSVLTAEKNDSSESLKKAHEEIRYLRENISRLEAKYAELSQSGKTEDSSGTSHTGFYQQSQQYRRRQQSSATSKPIDPPSVEYLPKTRESRPSGTLPLNVIATWIKNQWGSATKKFKTRSFHTKGVFIIFLLLSITLLTSFGSSNKNDDRDNKQTNESIRPTSVNPQIQGKQLTEAVVPTPVTSEKQVEEVPVVYTFFDNLDNVYDKDSGEGQNKESNNEGEKGQKDKQTDQNRRRLNKKTTSRDMEILQAWKDAWTAMGYIPRVLTLEDAKRHPDYESYSDILDKKVPLGSNKEYDKACYLRWLAMAVSGGLLLSDFDTVPLIPPQPGDLVPPEKFTFYQGFIPSLMKGTPQQWTTIAHAILEEATHPDRADLGLYSDMLALRELLKNPNKQDMIHVFKPEIVHNAMPFLEIEENSFSKADCRVFAKLRAVHFQHRSEVIKNDMTDNLIEGSDYKSRRATLMSRWSEFWPDFFKEHCSDTKSPWT